MMKSKYCSSQQELLFVCILHHSKLVIIKLDASQVFLHDPQFCDNETAADSPVWRATSATSSHIPHIIMTQTLFLNLELAIITRLSLTTNTTLPEMMMMTLVTCSSLTSCCSAAVSHFSFLASCIV